MKKKMKYYLILVLAILMGACENEDDSNTADDLGAQIAAVENTVTGTGWTISSFIDSGKDETNHFDGYVFTFNNSGALIAESGINRIEGTWSVTEDDSSSDDSMDDEDDIDFNIFFAAPEDFAELTDDWDIASRTSNRIELVDISGGDGSVETLVFTRD